MDYSKHINELMISRELNKLKYSAKSGEIKSVNMNLGEGSEFEFGGPGIEPGKFGPEIKDITFDKDNNLYILEGAAYDMNKRLLIRGNLRISKFNQNGLFISSFNIEAKNVPLPDDNIVNNDPTKMTVTESGDVYITQPKSHCVQIYSNSGEFKKNLPLSCAFALDKYVINNKEYVVVGQNQKDKVYDFLTIIEASTGNISGSFTLEKGVRDLVDICSDKLGNLYCLSYLNQIHKYNSQGKLVKSIGSKTNSGIDTGSELMHTINVDSLGNVYTLTWGNPGWITRFDSEFKTITQRQGQFRWADPWCVHSRFMPYAIDSNDNIWAITTQTQDKAGANYEYYHYSPAVIKLKKDFFSLSNAGVREFDALTIGLNVKITSNLPKNLGHDISTPTDIIFNLPAADRLLNEIDVNCKTRDVYGNVLKEENFKIQLENGVAYTKTVKLEPTKYGWYNVNFEISYQGKNLKNVGQHYAFTPKYGNMPTTLDIKKSNNSWADAFGQMFSGLPNIRLHAPVGGNLQELDVFVNQAIESKIEVIMQFSDVKDCTPENVSLYVNRYKDRIKYWEVMNEPNFSMNVTTYVELLKKISPIIKQIDPELKVLGPAHCGINLGFYTAFYKLGGGPFVDVLSFHDYEGHESIDEGHWRWKLGELRKIMSENGDADKPFWQTERVVGGIRGGNFLGVAQAIRATLHQDLLTSLGIEPRHNNFYYLNQGGYSKVPGYINGTAGTHPAQTAYRTRYAYTYALNRKYTKKLDFGVDGNDMFFGSLYEGEQGKTLILRNYGLYSEELTFNISGDAQITCVDAFGNESKIDSVGGKFKLKVTQLPQYLLLNESQEVTPIPIALGANVITPDTKITYTGISKNSFSIINDRKIQTIHDGNPLGGTGGGNIWTGDLKTDVEGKVIPETLEIVLPRPYEVDSCLIRSVRADNTFCALLDYDLLAEVEGNWIALASVRNKYNKPTKSESGETAMNMWYDDINMHINQFKSVVAQKFRIVALDATWGWAHGKDSNEVLKRTWGGKGLTPKLMLKEIKLFSSSFPGGISPTIGNGDGLAATYYDNSDLSGNSVSRVDGNVDFNWLETSPDPRIAVDTFSARWTGTILAPYSGNYNFYTFTDDGVRLWVDDKLIIQSWGGSTAKEIPSALPILLQKGKRYKIKMEYYDNTGKAYAKLSWASELQDKEVVPKTQLFSTDAPLPEPIPSKELEEAKAEVNILKSLLEIKTEQLTTAETTLATIRTEVDTIKAEKATISEELTKLETSSAVMTEELESLKNYSSAEISILKLEIEKLKAQVATLTKDKAALNSRLYLKTQELKRVIDLYNKYKADTKALLIKLGYTL